MLGSCGATVRFAILGAAPRALPHPFMVAGVMIFLPACGTLAFESDGGSCISDEVCGGACGGGTG